MYIYSINVFAMFGTMGFQCIFPIYHNVFLNLLAMCSPWALNILFSICKSISLNVFLVSFAAPWAFKLFFPEASSVSFQIVFSWSQLHELSSFLFLKPAPWALNESSIISHFSYPSFASSSNSFPPHLRCQAPWRWPRPWRRARPWRWPRPSWPWRPARTSTRPSRRPRPWRRRAPWTPRPWRRTVPWRPRPWKAPSPWRPRPWKTPSPWRSQPMPWRTRSLAPSQCQIWNPSGFSTTWHWNVPQRIVPAGYGSGKRTSWATAPCVASNGPRAITRWDAICAIDSSHEFGIFQVCVWKKTGSAFWFGFVEPMY